MNCEIARAKPGNAAVLTQIAIAAKRHWGYPERWIESWRPLLSVQPEFIAKNETYVAMAGARMVGFYGLTCREDKLELAHLWVLPEVMGRGIGRALFLHCLERAQGLGHARIEIESDPNAEGFYLRMGARRIGASLTEVDGQRRELPTLICEIRAVG